MVHETQNVECQRHKSAHRASLRAEERAKHAVRWLTRSNPHRGARSHPHAHGRPGTHTRSAEERRQFIYGLQLHPMPSVVKLFAYGTAGKREALGVARRVRAEVDDERCGDSKLRLELPKETLVLSMDPMSGPPARKSEGGAGKGKGKGTGRGTGSTASDGNSNPSKRKRNPEGDEQSSISKVYTRLPSPCTPLCPCIP